MSYAYLVVTLDTGKSPPRVLRAGLFAASGRTLPRLPGQFLFDVMMASGHTFELAKKNLFVMSKAVEIYAKEVRWAFELLPTEDLAAWKATPER